ncbi:hypothetical protein SUGI_0356600 [Cryptomeria japonica]|nr:hypothetical protein SUGI_0356600 [Cryptomeria japonica]
MAYNNLISMVGATLIICCLLCFLCADATEVACRGLHLEKYSVIAKLKRKTKTQVSGGVAPLNRHRTTLTVSIGIGTPPSNFYGQVDKGSDLIWFQCDSLNYAMLYDLPTFYREDSSTYRRVTCSSSFCSALGISTCASDCQYSHRYRESWST